MSNLKNFLENFKIEKALGGYSQPLGYGDKLSMFKCTYKVTSFEKGGYTMLEDEKNTRFAIPSKKLMLLLKKGIAVNHGALNIHKAFKVNIGGPSSKVGVSNRAMQQNAMPEGTVRTRSDGKKYVKEAAGSWRSVATGERHSSPESDKKVSAFDDAETRQQYFKLSSKLKTKIPSKYHDELETKLKKVIEQKHQIKGYEHAHSGVEKQGGKVEDDHVGSHKQIQESYAKNLEGLKKFLVEARNGK